MLSNMIILFLVILIKCDTVLDKQCTCNEIQNETDCKIIQYKYENGQLEKRKSISQMATCPIQGCGLYENTFQAYAGCTAYLCRHLIFVIKYLIFVHQKSIDVYFYLLVILTQLKYHFISIVLINIVIMMKVMQQNLNIKLLQLIKIYRQLQKQIKFADKIYHINETNSGCIDSGKNYIDQKTNFVQQIQIKIWNLNTITCYDYICTKGNVDDRMNYKDNYVLAETYDSISTTCKDIDECINYKFKDTCKIGVQGNCLWLVTQDRYVNYVCSQASDDYTNDQLCSQFLSNCIINYNDLGCKIREAQYSSYLYASNVFKLLMDNNVNRINLNNKV